MDVPTEEFMRELRQEKEGKDEYKNMLYPDQRESLSSSYFPYNKQIARALLCDKHVMFIGDSLIRAMYKDMVALLQTGELCSINDLRVSNEDSFRGDKHFDDLPLEANRVFRQGREFQSNRHLIQYYFTNRAMREDLEKTCLLIEASDERPDVVLINSAIWDVSRFPAKLSTRWKTAKMDNLEEEITVVEEYFNRISMFLRRMRCLLSPDATVIWVIMPPSSTPDGETKTGFLAQNQLTFHEIRMRLLEANVRVAQIVREAGFDVLDLSFHFRLSNYQVFRIKDGVHFNTVATRYMNQLVLGHLAVAWKLDDNVIKKWPQKIYEKTQDKSEYFTAAMDYLATMNTDKHINEHIQQEVRSNVFDDFKLSLPNADPNAITIEEFHLNLRLLLAFQKFNENSSTSAQGHAKAFAGPVPIELSRFSQEDLECLEKMMVDCCRDWKGEIPGLRMDCSNKRLLDQRPALLPTPSSAPPGVASNGDSDNSDRMSGGGSAGYASGSDSSMDICTSPESAAGPSNGPSNAPYNNPYNGPCNGSYNGAINGSTNGPSNGFSNGIPNRIADPEIPKKRARYNGPVYK